MNLSSNHKLRTIGTDQSHMSTLQQSQYHEFKKQKKQSNRKISLKQSAMKQIKNKSINQIVPKNKKSQQIGQSSVQHPSNPINISKSKLIKQVQQMTSNHKHSQDSRMQPKYSKNQINNKSLVFSQQKLTNPHNYSVLKGNSNAKLHSQYKKANKQKQHQSSLLHTNTQTSKKHSTKGSTTKKHSKSVYNYTEFDDYPLDKKKNSTKESMGVRKSRDSHNRSALTHQHHQVSTSSITKRVNKSKQALSKLLSNSSIKKTTNNFKVLSNCLKAYVEQQQMSNNKIDVGQIIKMIKAFNKTEIGHVSKPLQELICQIVGLIQDTVEKEMQHLQSHEGIKIKQKQTVKFETPQRLSKRHQETFPSSIHQYDFNNHQESQIILTPNDISKTKKIMSDSNNHNVSHSQQIHQNSLSKDLIKMQQGLENLKSQSKQLKKIIHQSASKKKRLKSQESEEEQKQQEIQKKKIEIHQLKQILQRQKYLMERIQNLSQSEQYIQQSQENELIVKEQ